MILANNIVILAKNVWLTFVFSFCVFFFLPLPSSKMFAICTITSHSFHFVHSIAAFFPFFSFFLWDMNHHSLLPWIQILRMRMPCSHLFPSYLNRFGPDGLGAQVPPALQLSLDDSTWRNFWLETTIFFGQWPGWTSRLLLGW